MQARWSSPTRPRLPRGQPRRAERLLRAAKRLEETPTRRNAGGRWAPEPQQRRPSSRPRAVCGGLTHRGPGGTAPAAAAPAGPGLWGSASPATGSPVGTACGRHTALVGTAFSQPTHFKVLIFISIIRVHSSEAKFSYKAQRKAAHHSPLLHNSDMAQIHPVFPRAILHCDVWRVQLQALCAEASPRKAPLPRHSILGPVCRAPAAFTELYDHASMTGGGFTLAGLIAASATCPEDELLPSPPQRGRPLPVWVALHLSCLQAVAK